MNYHAPPGSEELSVFFATVDLIENKILRVAQNVAIYRKTLNLLNHCNDIWNNIMIHGL